MHKSVLPAAACMQAARPCASAPCALYLNSNKKLAGETDSISFFMVNFPSNSNSKQVASFSAFALPRLGLSLKPLLARLGVVELLAYRFKLLVERLDAVLEGVDDGLRGVTLGLEGGDLALQRPSRLLVLAACLREGREIEGGTMGGGGRKEREEERAC